MMKLDTLEEVRSLSRICREHDIKFDTRAGGVRDVEGWVLKSWTEVLFHRVEDEEFVRRMMKTV